MKTIHQSHETIRRGGIPFLCFIKNPGIPRSTINITDNKHSYFAFHLGDREQQFRVRKRNRKT